jgi:hypothetical protein
MLQEEEYRGCLLSATSLLEQWETNYYVFIINRYTFPDVILRISVP